MSETNFISIHNNRSAFIIEENGERVAEMVVGIASNEMTVYHTEVNDQLKGKGVGKKLLDEMVEYCRQHNLKVIPRCTYVLAQFQRHEDEYSDIWKKL